MRRKEWIMLVLCFFLLTGCTTGSEWSLPITTAVPGVDTTLPDLTNHSNITVRTGSVLYFRYLDEPYLAPETRNITQMAGQSYEYALLSALIAGPGTHSASLNGVFPEGVKLISTVRQGRTLFVTLSADIMKEYADEPDNWQADDHWRREVPLRRQLCMQAIVASVTENCDVDRVQILVQQDVATGSLRLRQNYFMDDSEDDVLVGPMTRDEDMLLTQTNAARVALTHWMEKDWQRLYEYVVSTDPETGLERDPYAAFTSLMEIYPAITAFEVYGGGVTADGSSATVSISCRLLQDGQTTQVDGCILHLCRENGIWKISQSDLTEWIREVAP